MKILMLSDESLLQTLTPLGKGMGYEFILCNPLLWNTVDPTEETDINQKRIYDDCDMLIVEFEDNDDARLKFANEFRVTSKHDWKPIIVLSEKNDNETLVNVLGTGADIFIHKPVNPIKMIAQIRALERMVSIYKDLNATRTLLEQLVISDPLTNIANRRGFVNRLDLEWGRMKREKTPLSILMIDIDYFKQFNDLYGHPKGDDCLILLSSIIQDTLSRKTDLLGRYGGDEFIVLLPNTDLNGAQIIAENIKKAVYSAGIANGGSPIANVVTISIGVSSSEQLKTDNQFMLISSADSALYEAKVHGRNAICCFYSGAKPDSTSVQ